MSSKAITPVAKAENEYLGAGAIYYNYGTANEVLVGATKGGSEFTNGLEIKEIEQDGTYGPVKGQKRKLKVAPVLKVNALELTNNNLTKFYAGMDVDTTNTAYDKFKERLQIKDTDYIDNVAFVGENHKGQDIVVIVYNVLGDGPIEWAMAHEEEIVPEVQLTGHYDPDALLDIPYEIRKHKLATVYSVTFTVNDGTNPVEGAVIYFDGLKGLTDSAGNAVFVGVEVASNQPYKIKADGFTEKTGTVDVVDANVTPTVSLTAA